MVVKKRSLSQFCFYELIEVCFVASAKIGSFEKKSLFYLNFILLGLQCLRKPEFLTQIYFKKEEWLFYVK